MDGHSNPDVAKLTVQQTSITIGYHINKGGYDGCYNALTLLMERSTAIFKISFLFTVSTNPISMRWQRAGICAAALFSCEKRAMFNGFYALQNVRHRHQIYLVKVNLKKQWTNVRFKFITWVI